MHNMLLLKGEGVKNHCHCLSINMTMDPCRLKFQVIRTNGFRVMAVGSWPENIGNFCLLYLQFPVIFTQTSNGNNSGTICLNQLKLGP